MVNEYGEFIWFNVSIHGLGMLNQYGLYGVKR